MTTTRVGQRRLAKGLLLCFASALLNCTRERPTPDVLILNYHGIGADGEQYTVDEAQFAEQLNLLRGMGFVTTSFADYFKGQVERPAVILTFDDGRKDAITHALPALSQRRMRGTFFIITGSVGKTGFLTWSDIGSLRAAGMEIGSHSITHRHGSELSDDDLLHEFIQSRVDIETHLKEPIRVLAYPYNSFRRRMAQLAEKAGYDAAVVGPAHGTGDRFRLLRHGVYRDSTLGQFRQTLEGYVRR